MVATRGDKCVEGPSDISHTNSRSGTRREVSPRNLWGPTRGAPLGEKLRLYQREDGGRVKGLQKTGALQRGSARVLTHRPERIHAGWPAKCRVLPKAGGCHKVCGNHPREVDGAEPRQEIRRCRPPEMPPARTFPSKGLLGLKRTRSWEGPAQFPEW